MQNSLIVLVRGNALGGGRILGRKTERDREACLPGRLIENAPASRNCRPGGKATIEKEGDTSDSLNNQ